MRLLIRIMALCLFVILTALPCLAFSPGFYAMPGDIQDIQQSGILRVGVMDKMAPPFVFERNGQLQGYDVDLARGMADALGVKALFVKLPGGWDGLVDAVAQNSMDIGLCELSKTVARSQIVFFSRSYLTSHTIFVASRLVMAQTRFHEDASDPEAAVVRHFNQPNFRIATMGHSALEPLARQFFPQARLVLAPSLPDVLTLIQDSKADLAVFAETAFEVAVHTDPALLYKIARLGTGIEGSLRHSSQPGQARPAALDQRLSGGHGSGPTGNVAGAHCQIFRSASSISDPGVSSCA